MSINLGQILISTFCQKFNYENDSRPLTCLCPVPASLFSTNSIPLNSKAYFESRKEKIGIGQLASISFFLTSLGLNPSLMKSSRSFRSKVQTPYPLDIGCSIYDHFAGIINNHPFFMNFRISAIYKAIADNPQRVMYISEVVEKARPSAMP